MPTSGPGLMSLAAVCVLESAETEAEGGHRQRLLTWTSALKGSVWTCHGMERSRLGLLSTGGLVDQSELRSGPARRRHSADLLFRGYSSPVDLKTIELSCLRSQGCDCKEVAS
ncbi:unnamed protein product [Tetraodon nigroviridis]|uniref:(spotted green pufferfish) hypothetical protein n=1 Tax=Tetraodon nigroviridis TaxID=99883 RepID=Q4RRD3_TETNG|nr:unnamed protein product [Tetraodon nigroviridis]